MTSHSTGKRGRHRLSWLARSQRRDSRRAQPTSAPAAANALAVGAPIAPAAPVMAAICPASGSSLRSPSLACSSGQYSPSNMSASEIDSNWPMRFGIADHGHPFLGDVGGDGGVAFGAAETEQAQPRHQHDAGQGIELALDAADPFVLWRLNTSDNASTNARAASRVACANSSSLPASGCGTTSGQFLVRMVWSGVTTPPRLSTARSDCRQTQNGLAAAKFKYLPPPRAFDLVVLLAASAADDGCDRRDRLKLSP